MKSSTCSENGKKFEIEFPKAWNCKKIHIDGELIKDQKIRKCDYGFILNCDKKSKIALIYVELKGQDLKEAIIQLESTIKILKEQYIGYRINQAHAVCAKIIPHMTSSAQVAAMRFKKDYGFILRWHSQYGKSVINI